MNHSTKVITLASICAHSLVQSIGLNEGNGMNISPNRIKRCSFRTPIQKLNQSFVQRADGMYSLI